MKVAVPVENGKVCGHFGHAPQFAIAEIVDNKIGSSSLETPPPHEPGVLPKWLQELGVEALICGGIGARAVDMLNAAGIKVIAGVQIDDPARAIEEFLAGNLAGAQGPTCQGHGPDHTCSH